MFLNVEEYRTLIILMETHFLNISLEMDDSQINEVVCGVSAIPRPVYVSSPSPLYAAPSPSASRPLSPGGKCLKFS